ncbi:MAG: hypothetical protein J6A23_05525 [Thermoguttaceae bacterium]|nr:hypothetical protein [Thermoguttaceae bacterium]
MHSLRLESLESRQMLSTNPIGMPAADVAEIVGGQNNDVTASIPTAKWLGDVSTGWYDAENVKESYTLQTAAQFAGFAELVNSGVTFEGITITLACNINLNNIEWTPIGQSFMPNGDDSYDENPFLGTFDGGGCTISNLKITGDGDYAGLFGCIGYKVGNFTLDGVSVSGDCYVGGAVGKVHWDVRNFDIHDITVKNFEVTGNQKVGGILGAAYCWGENIIQNCSVESGSVNQVDPEEGHCGGIVGQYMEGGENQPNYITNCTVKDVEITGGRRTGGIVGSTTVQSESNAIDELFYGNTIENVTLTGISVEEMKAPGAIVGWSNDAFDASDDSVSKSNNTVKNVSVKYTNDEGVLVDIPVTALGAQSTADGTVQNIEPVVAVIRDKDGNTTYSFSDFYEAVWSDLAYGNDVVIQSDLSVTFGEVPANVNIVTNGHSLGLFYGANFGAITIDGVTYASLDHAWVQLNVTDGKVTPRYESDVYTAVDQKWFYNAGETDTYTISTVKEFLGFSALVQTGQAGTDFAGKTILLGDDIDLTGVDFTQIGLMGYSKPFRGSFDGQGHTISGLTIDNEKAEGLGLFGYVNGQNTTIGNFKLENVTVNGQHWVAGVCGYATGTIAFKDIELTGDISITGRWYTGGIVGQVPYTNFVDFINCKVSGNEGSKIASVPYTPEEGETGFTGGGINAGGILGHGAYTEIKDCEVSGITVEAYYRAGGLAGYAAAEMTSSMPHTGNTVSDCVIIANKAWSEDYTDSDKDSYGVGALFGVECFYNGDGNLDSNSFANVTTKIVMQDGTEVVTSTEDDAPAIGARTKIEIYDSEGNSLGTYYVEELAPDVLTFDLKGDITTDDICFAKNGECALDSVGLNINTNGHTLTITDPNNTELLDNLAANSPEAKVEIIDVAWYDDAPEGTTEYTIDSAHALAYFAELVNSGKDTFEGKTVKLAEGSEIDLSIYEKWTPIGTTANSFWGTFDGQNSVISNLTINDAAQSYAGLLATFPAKPWLRTSR